MPLMEENLQTIEIEGNAELLRQAKELIQPMGINMEQLIQMFCSPAGFLFDAATGKRCA